ncbi:MAG: Uncharacterised protein [Acidimicrobiaceae bacterium]|nr:MAG: Uncharacterised protein [Acidimicrobiaceae bacterium]
MKTLIKQKAKEEIVESVSEQPEKRIANHLALRALLVSPLFLVLSAIGWGLGGTISALIALALVSFNFLAGAAIITRTVKISLNMLYGSVLGGYVVRLAILTGVVMSVRSFDWFKTVPFAMTLLVTHLGLLATETRYISASLAYPDLKPTNSKEIR